MRKNEYNSLEEFIFEYCKGRESSSENPEHRQRFMGIEFSYKGIFYRMCREPIDDGQPPLSGTEKKGQYNVMIMHCITRGYPVADSFESLGWYSDLDDLLNNCIIDEKPFREVIMDDNTEILGKD